ncbi:MAG: hypothetical protein H6841_03395 [Planctomycetes bacterium]|nr:hypothetical protein [Planctomycetota bacterium]MCB9934164.1 hypothetical protein [Planctomycetota bacterium]
MLVVVLGLLVALFVIGTSFSFVTLSERKAAQNYLDRQRALDLALDGVEYSIARLRAEATTKHYEGIGPSVAGLDDAGTEYDPRRYALQPLDAANPSVSWNKAASKTSPGTAGDGNWVDFNGDNNRGGDETGFGSDKNNPSFARGVTGYHADGINANQIPNKDVPFPGEGRYGPSGTYEELGDYFRVRAVDAASLLNINNFRDQRLRQVLLTLGDAIDSWLNRGKPSGRDNPLPAVVVDEFMKVAEENGWVFTSKEQLRPIWHGFENGDRMYDLAMNFITVNSWVDQKYRDFCDSNNKVDEDKNANPLGLTELELNREGFSRNDMDGRDGWPDWQPAASGFGKAPVNINTAPKPVLVCLFANLEAKARLLFFQKHDQITQSNKLIKDKFAVDVAHQISGTPDIGRQNNRADLSGTGIQGEGYWYPSGEDNRAIFQLVPIGPISTSLGKSGATSSQQGGGEDYASALADEVMRVRAMAPFTSWQDFDARFCRGILLGMNDNDRSNVKIPDLVGAPRSSLQRNSQAVEGAYPKKLLPDAANCNHAANAIKSSDVAMAPSDFRAWYWKSCVDMIRAALCPVNLTARYNVDYPLHMNVDRMDLVVTSSPICFSSMGVYEILSQGEIMAPEPGLENTTSSTPIDQRLPVARRQVRTTVQIYEVMRHASQRDWVTSPSVADINTRSTSAQPTTVDALTTLTKYDTKSGPFSMDELDMGIWRVNEGDHVDFLKDLDDGKAIAYEKAQAGQPSPAKDRVKGHNPRTAASGDFGYVFMNPRDETPFDDMKDTNPYLTFHARFNQSLRARTKSTAFQYLNGGQNVKVQGVNSDSLGRDEAWGHLPWETGAAFDDFISSATPRSKEKALAVGGGGLANEFDNADSGDEATKYATLHPDGAYLGSGALRPRAERSLKGSYGIRGLGRVPRLKLLRYPCGAQEPDNPFQPIRPYAWYADGEKEDGVDDPKQAGYLDPTSAPSPTDDPLMRERLIGLAPPFRGSDQHNRDAENNRQTLSNMPYYEGTVDFWIKWDLPPQGANHLSADVVVSLGEIDPASHNFSALFGATAYGRFKDSNNLKAPDGTNRNASADFEGVQFFVYKEPGGVLRFTRLYFSEAFGANIVSGPTGSTPQTVGQFGTAMRRIFDVANPLGGYTGTNDVCNDRGYADGNKGFLYARTDAWVDLNKATYVGGATLGAIMLRPHDWHRFTMSYNSNTENPYRLWLDGRQVQPVEFIGDTDINQPKGFRNDGRHAPLTDQALPATEPQGSPGYNIQRTTTMLLEINPEDRLTVGCIFRRQVDLTTTGAYGTYYAEADDQADLVKPARPVFKFDSNIVAVANATVDDFRIANKPLDPAVEIDPTKFQIYSRYDPDGTDCYYENGFLPIQGDDNMLHALPVRLGTISWTELRPDWDPYQGKGLTLRTSSHVEMEWGVVDDYGTINAGGGKTDLKNVKHKGASGIREGSGVKDEDYWAYGGMSLQGAMLPSGTKVGVLLYRAHFRVGKDIVVNNVTAYLLEVKVTVMTPPRKLAFVIEY